MHINVAFTLRLIACACQAKAAFKARRGLLHQAQVHLSGGRSPCLKGNGNPTIVQQWAHACTRGVCTKGSAPRVARLSALSMRTDKYAGNTHACMRNAGMQRHVMRSGAERATYASASPRHPSCE